MVHDFHKDFRLDVEPKAIPLKSPHKSEVIERILGLREAPEHLLERKKDYS